MRPTKKKYEDGGNIPETREERMARLKAEKAERTAMILAARAAAEEARIEGSAERRSLALAKPGSPELEALTYGIGGDALFRKWWTNPGEPILEAGSIALPIGGVLAKTVKNAPKIAAGLHLLPEVLHGGHLTEKAIHANVGHEPLAENVEHRKGGRIKRRYKLIRR